jgi:hypothetical protein
MLRFRNIFFRTSSIAAFPDLGWEPLTMSFQRVQPGSASSRCEMRKKGTTSIILKYDGVRVMARTIPVPGP